MLTNFYDPKNICSFFRQWIMHFFVLTISNHRLSLSNESSKTINPFIPEISLPAREEPDQLLPKREKKKRVIARCRFLESIFGTHWLIVQYRIFFKTLPDKGQSSEFYSFAAFPSRSLHTLLFFPRKQPILTDPRFHHYFPLSLSCFFARSNRRQFPPNSANFSFTRLGIDRFAGTVSIPRPFSFHFD